MMREQAKICVIGGGYVGLATAACFSHLGYPVNVVEKDNTKIAQLKQGAVPFYEPSLGELVEEGIEAETLSFYPDIQAANADNPEFYFICVGTPSLDSGACDLSFVEQAFIEILESTKSRTDSFTIVIKSTVSVGSNAYLSAKIPEARQSQIAVVNNPEFLREGFAVRDFLRPDRVVIGGRQAWAIEKMKGLYESFLINGHPLYVTVPETAELAKLSANFMLASRISAVNQVSRLAHAYEADIKQIESILKSDSRIGSQYLYAGIGYGGSCFPKDVKNFIDHCHQKDVNAAMAIAAHEFNRQQKHFFSPYISQRFSEPEQTNIALLGLAFKPDTDDIREAPALDVAKDLTAKGFKLWAYDPKAGANFKRWLCEEKINNVTVCRSLEQALAQADALIMNTEWQEFRRITPLKLSKHAPKLTAIYDGRNIYTPEKFKKSGYEYMGIGRV